ncbi:MAG TPA: phosphate ABC transporter substrate-binding protein PstS [Acidimicrobiales bacterium]|nr:phosphate ABC transporter substrate-binding protein PstS [Acidimicrobiales bacterium]
MSPTTHGGSAAQRRPAARGRRRLGAAGMALIAASLTSAAVLSPLAGAAVHARPSKSGSGSSSSGPSLSNLESSLAKLQKLAHSGDTLSETGSTLFYPLFEEWQGAKPLGLNISPAGTGSGTGQADAEGGTVNIGASDAYLPASIASNVLDIPIVVSAQQIDYNIPGLSSSTHVKLNADILNGIYTGQITNWDNSQITSINSGIKLPNLPIVPLRRSDGSGDTFLFTSYLDFAASNGGFVQSTMGGPNTSSTSFPSVSGEQAETGNSGMLGACEAIKGCIAYIGVSYLRSALSHGLGDASLENGEGNYVELNRTTINNEVASFKHIPGIGNSDGIRPGALSLVDSKSAKDGYPIVNFEYAIVLQSQPSTATADDVKALLAWGADPNDGAASSYLEKLNFLPLAPNALAVTLSLLDEIS